MTSKMDFTKVSIILFVLTAPKFCTCYQCSGPDVSLDVIPDADVKFTVILTLREPTPDNKCGTKWSDVALQTAAVIQWATERINDAGFIQGVKLGFEVYDDCGIERYSIGRALDVVDGYPLGSDACAARNDTVCQIGIIGTSRSDTTAVILDIINGTDVPLLSPFATYPALSEYSSFFRTTLSQDQQLQAILQYLLEVNWRYIAVVHTGGLFGQYGSQALKNLGAQHGICVDVIFKISNLNDGLADLFTKLKNQKQRTKDGSLGVVFLGQKEDAAYILTQLKFRLTNDASLNDIYWIMPDLVGNVNIFENLDNSAGNKTVVFSKFSTDLPSIEAYVLAKWKNAMNNSGSQADDVDALFACTGKTAVPKWTNEHAESVTDAVYILASALQRQQRYYCSGQLPICKDLRHNFSLESDLFTSPLNYSELPASVTVPEFAAAKRAVPLTAEGEVEASRTNPLYELYMYTRYENNSSNIAKVANFENNTIVASNRSRELYLDELKPSKCGISCPACVDSSEPRFIYVDGDALILGLFGLHETDPTDPFRCGDVRFSSSDILVLEAFLHKLEQLNNNDDPGVKFGAVIFDDCYSSAQLELVITQFMSGELLLKKPGSSSEIIDKAKIVAAVGSLGSDRAIVLSFLFTALKIPYISSSSSSPDLDDRINFPYFLRTVPSDVDQARAMVEIMKVMEWEYASALYVSNNYGSKGLEQFLRFANASNICIAEPTESLPSVDTAELNLQTIFSRFKNQNAKVVMYFGTEARIADFLNHINNRNDFVFLASEDWGDQEYLLEIGGFGTLGSIILKNQGVSLPEDDSFVEFVKQLNPYNNIRNPWFTEYWEHLFECNLPLSFNNKYAENCDPSQTFSVNSIQEVLKNQRIIHIIDAVEALWVGLQKSRIDFCEYANTFPCTKYFQNIAEVVANIKGVTLRRGNRDVRIFKDDGNGNVGFVILNVQQDRDQKLFYQQVGSYDDQGLHLLKSSIKLRQANFDAMCTPSLCGHCTNTSEARTIIEVVTHVHPTDNSFTTPHYTIVGLLAFLIVLMLIMMVIVLCYFKRRVAALHKQLKQTCNDLKNNTASPALPPPRNYPYVNQNGSAVPSNQGHSKNGYPPMNFVRLGPSGETLQDWRDAQMLLNGGSSERAGVNNGNAGSTELHGGNVARNGGGQINIAFIGDDQAFQSPSGGEHGSNFSAQSQVRSDSTNDQDSQNYKPSKSAYGLSTHNSFKRVDPNSQLNSPLKKQPRTQLAVPPCRPELPPRNEHAQRPDNLDLALPTAVPKERPRKHRSPPRKSSMSPRELKYTQSFDNNNARNKYASGDIESPRFKGAVQNMMFSAGAVQSEDHQTSPSSRINVHGSMEKISRV